MNDLQSKFAITLVAFGLFFGYSFPKLTQAKHDQDGLIQRVGQVYIDPNPNDPRAPHGYVSIDEIQKYADLKAAERKAMGLR